MDFLELAKQRYTTKKYNPDEKLSLETIEKLKAILKLSPSSINSQPWHFTFISNPEIKKRIAEASYFNAPKVLESSHTVVFSVIDDIHKFEEQIEKKLPEGAVGYYKQYVKPLSDEEIKAWLKNQVYLSLGYFLSACASLGIDSTPMEGIEKDKYRKILDLTDYQPLFAVAIGKRDQEDVNQPHIKTKLRLEIDEIITEM
ncbi:nitroreductase family protein [Flavobacterium oreochromis]|uniref:NAD(P)H-dependent oxidoreductase n=2 Tax=Flavobacterium TaxID=237 RepID=A0A246GA50_9FLAO|nr:nitroreductase family protein [Flavobacterium oreochromis]OWP76752.1 NAD(P)H-dependent oxidoreductase [Flavobacterium oreochromis]OWP78074.1 NAD(P)H-dependent oxidoreductase [Flavobacterium oreochromis]POR20670.1 NAD(P)H-dependent oxidoreductase [Flavobacterium columnare]QYS85898.1 nitroreductase family protein [Flavobacterium oreochromis]